MADSKKGGDQVGDGVRLSSARRPLHNDGGIVLQPIEHGALLRVGLQRKQGFLAKQPVSGGRSAGRPGKPLILLERKQQLGKSKRAGCTRSRQALSDPVVVLHPRIAVPLTKKQGRRKHQLRRRLHSSRRLPDGLIADWPVHCERLPATEEGTHLLRQGVRRIGRKLLLHPDDPLPYVTVLVIEEVPVLQPGWGLWRESDGQPGGDAVDNHVDPSGDEMPEHPLARRYDPGQ